MAVSASTSSSSFNNGSYDVFLSFRGPDTRQGFTGFLYKALYDRGIHTFIDDEELQKGDQITPALVEAIQKSKIAIVVLSKNYASSLFCLDELIHIIDCKEKGALVLPVFYYVDPSDVRRQKGSYGEALVTHEEKYKVNMERLEKWKMALQQVADLSGWHLKHGGRYEYESIEDIVKEVSNKINRAPLHITLHTVGLESRVLRVKSLLDGGSDDGVCMVGIHGISGIEHLQKTLLSKIFGEKDIKFGSFTEGIPIIRHRVNGKKVLLVLDDVDNLEQLKAIVGEPDWFGSGSKIIITTQDKRLLAFHGIDRTYEVEELNNKEALELLCWNAFKTDKVDERYNDILSPALTYASGLPLALKVVASYLSRQSIEKWKSALDKYERIPNKKIQDTLKKSFDSLEDPYEKEIFLDIACCFKGYALAYVKKILDAHHCVDVENYIQVLIEKSLIKIVDGCLTLHNLIEDMGKDIVQQESLEEPGKCSRLWFHEDIVQVLKENTV